MMPVYLGSLGRLVKLPYVGSQQVQAEERYNFSSTLEGKRKAQVKPKGPRTWALSADHFRPNEHSLLSQFTNGDWGSGPFWFVSADAPHTNLLTPAGAACRELQSGSPNIKFDGPVDLGSDGWAASSLRSDDPFAVSGNGAEIYMGLDFIPVIPGQQVTASAWVKGAGSRVRLYWYDSTLGSVLGGPVSVFSGGPEWSRVHVTGTPPANAVACRMIALNAERATRPAITWSNKVLEWGDGQGCSKAVVHGFSRDQVLAVPGSTYSNVSCTVTEVG